MVKQLRTGGVVPPMTTGQVAGYVAHGQNLDNRGAKNEAGSQVLMFHGLASLRSFEAEGTGFEPATPFRAPHFQCGR